MKSGASDADRLDALADLLEVGPPAEALAALVRLGGGVARWARPLEAGARSMPLGMVLAQQQVLTDAELAFVGGAAHAGRPASLRVVAARRRARRVRGRVLWAALWVPLIVVLLSAGANRFVLGLLGGSGPGWLGDVAPVLLLATAVFVGVMDRRWTLRPLAGLPGVGRLIALHQAARVAESLGAALLHAPLPEALVAAGRLAAAPALTEAGDRMRAGTAPALALPTADALGEPLALALTAGLAAGDLPARLLAFAHAADAHLTTRLRTLVKVLAWVAVVWVNLRGLWALTSVDLQGLGGGGLLPGVNPRDVDDLMRELDL